MNMFKRKLCKALGCECISEPEELLGDFEPHIKQPTNTFMRTSKRGLDLIKEFETFVAAPYWDKTGKVWTQGYGSTGKGITKTSLPITEVQASRLLMIHVEMVEEGINQLVKTPISQNQFDALVSFAYNVGLDIDDDTKAEGLGDSTLLKYINLHRLIEAAEEFPKWRYSGGVELRGLLRRRMREREMFLDFPETVEV